MPGQMALSVGLVCQLPLWLQGLHSCSPTQHFPGAGAGCGGSPIACEGWDVFLEDGFEAPRVHSLSGVRMPQGSDDICKCWKRESIAHNSTSNPPPLPHSPHHMQQLGRVQWTEVLASFCETWQRSISPGLVWGWTKLGNTQKDPLSQKGTKTAPPLQITAAEGT